MIKVEKAAARCGSFLILKWRGEKTEIVQQIGAVIKIIAGVLYRTDMTFRNTSGKLSEISIRRLIKNQIF